jgi:hypothetical protein
MHLQRFKVFNVLTAHMMPMLVFWVVTLAELASEREERTASIFSYRPDDGGSKNV